MSFDWRHLPSLSSLRAFDATARNGGFSGAGRALNVTHAAIAQQVRQLEKEMGVNLVARTGRAVSLTEAGTKLALALSEGFTTIADGIEDLRRTENQRGLRINTTTFIADAIILPRLSEFWAKHPGIEVAMLPSTFSADIVKDGFDLAISGWSIDTQGTEAIHLAQSRVVVVGAPSLFDKKPPNPETLPWIWSSNNNHEQEMMRAAGLDPEKLRRVELGSARLEVAAARQGLGLIVATEIIIRDDLAAGRLQEVPMPGLPEVGYYVVMPKGPRREAVEQFVAWLMTIF